MNITKIKDLHMHVSGDSENIKEIMKTADLCGYDNYNVLSLACSSRRGAVNNLTCLLTKISDPRAYAFGGFVYDKNGHITKPLLEQVKELSSQGFDGIKMLEGKPDIRRYVNRPLDDPELLPAFAYMEKNGIPLLMHSCDPEEFWTEDCPSWAKKSGWWWGDSCYKSKEEITKESLSVIEKFPGLKIVLAHFFFVSTDIDYAAALMERYPNFNVDITPGWEMYGNFTAKHDEWRDFFIKYSKRIYYGSDIHNGTQRDAIFSGVTRFITTEDKFLDGELGLSLSTGEMKIHGINLPEEAICNIFCNNFGHFIINKAKPDPERILYETKKQLEADEFSKNRDMSEYIKLAGEMEKYI